MLESNFVKKIDIYNYKITVLGTAKSAGATLFNFSHNQVSDKIKF